jgi:hypothetical protein
MHSAELAPDQKNAYPAGFTGDDLKRMFLQMDSMRIIKYDWIGNNRIEIGKESAERAEKNGMSGCRK